MYIYIYIYIYAKNLLVPLLGQAGKQNSTFFAIFKFVRCNIKQVSMLSHE